MSAFRTLAHAAVVAPAPTRGFPAYRPKTMASRGIWALWGVVTVLTVPFSFILWWIGGEGMCGSEIYEVEPAAKACPAARTGREAVGARAPRRRHRAPAGVRLPPHLRLVGDRRRGATVLPGPDHGDVGGADRQTYGHLLPDSEEYQSGLLDACDGVRGLSVDLAGGSS